MSMLHDVSCQFCAPCLEVVPVAGGGWTWGCTSIKCTSYRTCCHQTPNQPWNFTHKPRPTSHNRRRYLDRLLSLTADCRAAFEGLHQALPPSLAPDRFNLAASEYQSYESSKAALPRRASAPGVEWDAANTLKSHASRPPTAERRNSGRWQPARRDGGATGSQRPHGRAGR